MGRFQKPYKSSDAMISVPKVAIIILNWNGLEDTLECLHSVYLLDYKNFEVFIVDNGSTDTSAKIIPQKYPAVNLISNRSNLGYTGGNNIGIKKALERGAQYIWLLNNDTIVDIQCLQRLVTQADKSSSIGILSPVVKYYDQPQKIQFCGSYADARLFKFTALKTLDEKIQEGPGRYVVQWGTALLIHRKVIKAIGGLNDKYFAYFEDFEFSVRAVKAGYQSMIVPNAVIFHKDSRTTGSRKAPMQVHLRVRNEYFFWMTTLVGFKKVFYFRHFWAQTLSLAATYQKEGRMDSFFACLDGGWSAVWQSGGPIDPSVRFPVWLRKILFSHIYMWIGLLRGDYMKTVKTIRQRIKRKNYKSLKAVAR